MKKIFSLLSFALFSVTVMAQSDTAKYQNMKMNAGIITSKLAESKAFYTKVLGFDVVFENEFYLLLNAPGGHANLSFLLPNHPSQQPLFRKAFQGQGIYLTIEVEDVDKLYAVIKKKGVPIKIELRDEPWGDRHFAIEDPNGVGIDLVHYKAPGTK
ncbi:MAG TPA: VOC family protein [Pseudobacter sp.]|nr:VOC family protein [Pseudobacter sp.]